MTSRAERRRRNKRAVERASPSDHVRTADNTPSPPTDEIQRPTAQRMSQGVWSIAGKSAPAVDLACDYIGRLYQAKLIEYHHHEAARLFQGIVAAFMADLPIAGYRSCLAGGTGAYDSGDGSPEAARQYEAMKRKLGAVRFLYLRTETEKPVNARVGDLVALKRALEAVVR